MSNLVEYAKNELERAEIEDYDGMIEIAVLEIVTVFSKQGHSGFSAQLTIDILNRLLRYEPLTSLTFEDKEWIKHAEPPEKPVWQHCRKASVFSDDEGKTWYDLDEEGSPRHQISHV